MPSRFVAITRRHSLKSISVNWPPIPVVPALANTASIRPPAASTDAANVRSVSSSSATSQRKDHASTPSARSVSTAAWFLVSLRPHNTMSAPAAAHPVASAKPMPPFPPVTNTVLPASCPRPLPRSPMSPLPRIAAPLATYLPDARAPRAPGSTNIASTLNPDGRTVVAVCLLTSATPTDRVSLARPPLHRWSPSRRTERRPP